MREGRSKVSCAAPNMENSYFDDDYLDDADVELEEEERERIQEIDDLVSKALPEAPDDFVDEESEENDEENDENRRGLVSEDESRRLQYDQLEILYAAQNRQIRQLGDELEREKADGEKAKRILNHHLAAARMEIERKTKEFDQIIRLLENEKNRNRHFEAQIENLNVEIQSLIDARDKAMSDLVASRTALDSVKQQLHQVNRSETLTRARQDHERSLAALTQRHHEELLAIRQELDVANQGLTAKDTELDHVREQLAKALREGEMAKLDRAELVNKLTRNLEESQSRNQQLLESGGSHQVAELKVQLQRLGTACQEKQSENDSLRLQISEMDKRIQTERQESEERLNSTIAQLRGTNGYKTCSTTETDFVQLNFSFENVVGQLEAKEQEVSSLTNHVEQLKRVIEDERRRRCEGETRANRAEIATLEANNSIEVRKELEKRVEELEIELRKQTARHEEEKKESLEKCRQGCLQLHTASYERLKETLKQEHSKQMNDLRSELRSREVNAESREAQLRREMDELEDEKERSVEEQRRVLSEEHKMQLALLKADWLREKDKEIKEAVKNAVQIARSQWKCDAERERRSDEAKRSELEARRQKDVAFLQSHVRRLEDELKRTKLAKEEEAYRTSEQWEARVDELQKALSDLRRRHDERKSDELARRRSVELAHEAALEAVKRKYEKESKTRTFHRSASVHCQTESSKDDAFVANVKALYETALAKMKSDTMAYVKRLRKQMEIKSKSYS
ncbi:centrosomal protein of 152 kDa-like isoform X2 [Oscarella lobularis]|uniref:centrosomal protein of 152 kDa-like isoform X2 n=1 Tax=Oscarella lobularis TaxID=121494 RepID=UPI003313BD53